MDIKSKIQQNIVIPSNHGMGTYSTVAQVVDSNEKANCVTIKFKDKEGYMRTEQGVPIKIYNSAIIDWFPSSGEAVVIEQSDDYICVTSKYEGSYTTMTRTGTLLKNDVLGETFNSIFSGFIL